MIRSNTTSCYPEGFVLRNFPLDFPWNDSSFWEEFHRALEAFYCTRNTVKFIWNSIEFEVVPQVVFYGWNTEYSTTMDFGKK